MLGKSERRRIHGLILATLLHSGGPLLMVFLAERPTPTTRQVSSGGPPPQVQRDPGQPPHRSCPVSVSDDSATETLTRFLGLDDIGLRPPLRHARPGGAIRFANSVVR